MPGFRREGAFSPAMTTRLRNARHGTTYRLLNTCDQMAIMPMNSASDASAAASWITALNMVLSLERSENIVHVMFFCQAWRWPLSTSSRKQWFFLVPVICQLAFYRSGDRLKPVQLGGPGIAPRLPGLFLGRLGAGRIKRANSRSMPQRQRLPMSSRSLHKAAQRSKRERYAMARPLLLSRKRA